MMRKIHYVLTLAAALLILSMAVTGAMLSLQPALESTTQSSPAGGSLAPAVAAIAEQVPDVVEIARNANGKLTATDDFGDSFVITGPDFQAQPAPASSGFFGVMKQMHRSFFLHGKGGGIMAATAAGGLLLICVSGAFLLARRMGGWKAFFAPAKGTAFQKLHIQVSRLVLGFLVLSTATGLFLSASTFGLLPSDLPEADFPFDAPEGPSLAYDQLPALAAVPLSDLRSLELPYPDDPAPVLYLQTANAELYISGASGALLSADQGGVWTAVYNFFYMLHAGEGLAWLGILLGLAALAVPFLAVTGIVLWLRRITARSGSVSSGSMDSEAYVLVGSETGSTWPFAQSLAQALEASGTSTFITSMNDGIEHLFRPEKQVFILAASYGQGEAPQSASGFLPALERAKSALAAQVHVLGFGDRSFSDFCGYAAHVHENLRAHGVDALSYAEIDRQSVQSFETWGRERGLTLSHAPKRITTQDFTLRARETFGEAVNAPVSRLVFDAPKTKFEPGDLVGFYPPGSNVARFYSVGSSSLSGELVLLVRHLEKGACSSHLRDLNIGDSIPGFVQTNPRFHLPKGRTPVVMIAAGTGLAPFEGFAKANNAGRELHLFWGGRSEASDDLTRKLRTSANLASLHTCFSRDGQGYVQDLVAQQPELIANCLNRKGTLMICGSTDMADGVCAVFEDQGWDIRDLKDSNRLILDVY